MSRVQDFNEADWEFEISSGFNGYRHKVDGNWIHESTFTERQELRDQYDYDYKVIHDFRRDCLPFGEYPDYVIQEFLENKYNK
ncbi:MAG: hypothetical protein PQJ49_04380 [Sphaerochaetaceae bacterium]|nr:hypothetical protein [Sphaerochaetaceae bacterium]